VGHEINWALSDFAADLRAPTPSAAAELVSANREEALESIAMLRDFLYETIKARIERVRLLAKPFSMEDLEYRFRAILQPRLLRLDDAKEALLTNLEAKLDEYRRRMELARRGLEAGSPLSIMERGFSVAVNERTGKVIRRFTEVKKGDIISIKPLEGIITAAVETAQERE
jgi:exodeoxyribonuclease VII large subunit